MHHKQYTPEQIRNKVLYYINYRIRTQKEILNKLQSLNADSEYISSLMEELEEMGLVNDEKFIHFFVREYLEVKKFGMYRVKQELQKKGFSPLLIQEHLSQEEYDPLEEAYLVLIQKYQNRSSEDHKMLAFLGRRGFSYSEASQALKKYKAEYQ